MSGILECEELLVPEARDVRVHDLGPHADRVEVVEGGPWASHAARRHLVHVLGARRERLRPARDGREPHRDERGAVGDVPDVAAGAIPLQAGAPVSQLGREPGGPDVPRLGHVRVDVDDPVLACHPVPPGVGRLAAPGVQGAVGSDAAP